MKTHVLSLGGSLIAPDDIDVEFLKKFRQVINKTITGGNRAVIVCGGGKVCRRYQDSAKRIAELSDDELDWLGIYATHFNAQLVRMIFKSKAHQEIGTDPRMVETDKPIIIAAGWLPGHSTDYDAVLWAVQMKSDTVVNVSNIDFVYDKNPYEYKDAKPLEKLSWKRVFKIIGTKWRPGLNVPFDPMAAKLAQKNKIRVIVLGPNLKNLENYFAGKKFKRTVIS